LPGTDLGKNKKLFDKKNPVLKLINTQGVVNGITDHVTNPSLKKYLFGEQQYCRKWHSDKTSKTVLGQNGEKIF
jgi:hypothetical protein